LSSPRLNDDLLLSQNGELVLRIYRLSLLDCLRILDCTRRVPSFLPTLEGLKPDRLLSLTPSSGKSSLLHQTPQISRPNRSLLAATFAHLRKLHLIQHSFPIAANTPLPCLLHQNILDNPLPPLLDLPHNLRTQQPLQSAIQTALLRQLTDATGIRDEMTEQGGIGPFLELEEGDVEGCVPR